MSLLFFTQSVCPPKVLLREKWLCSVDCFVESKISLHENKQIKRIIYHLVQNSLVLSDFSRFMKCCIILVKWYLTQAKNKVSGVRAAWREKPHFRGHLWQWKSKELCWLKDVLSNKCLLCDVSNSDTFHIHLSIH